MRRHITTHAALLITGLVLGHAAIAHGDVTPQAVDTKELPALGAQWRNENPYRKNEKAVRIGSSAYNQNCARCHGLEGISGGIAPDLRKLDNECASLKDEKKKVACVKEIDDFFSTAVRRGRTRKVQYASISAVDVLHLPDGDGAELRNARLASFDGALHHLGWIHEFDADRDEPTDRQGGTWL